MDEISKKETPPRYPHCGVISQCTDRGFGFVSSSSDQDEFIQIRDHSGRRLDIMERLEGKASAYVIGGHAFRCSQGKNGWQSTVVQWRLLDDIDPPLNARLNWLNDVSNA